MSTLTTSTYQLEDLYPTDEGIIVDCPFLPFDLYQADTLGHPYSDLDTQLVSHSGFPFSQLDWLEWITPSIIVGDDEIPF